jgi:hypothetical protein
MPRSLCVAILVFSLVLNGCASSPYSVQPEAPAEQKIVWDPPPEKPNVPVRDWGKEHPWLTGTTIALITVVGLTAIVGSFLLYAQGMASIQNRN